MSIYDTPENRLKATPEPPDWMNPTMAKLFTYHCDFFLAQDALLKTGVHYLQIFASLEYEMVTQRIDDLPLDIEMNQAYKSYCDDMQIDPNVNTRIKWLKSINWSFTNGANT